MSANVDRLVYANDVVPAGALAGKGDLLICENCGKELQEVCVVEAGPFYEFTMVVCPECKPSVDQYYLKDYQQ